MRHLVLIATLLTSSVYAQQGVRDIPILTSSYYIPTAQAWINQYIIDQQENKDILIRNTVLSPAQMQVILNALYCCITWVQAEQEVTNTFIKAAITFKEAQQYALQGTPHLTNLEQTLKTLVEQCATSIGYKKYAHNYYQSYLLLEPLLLSEPVHPAWYALNNNHADAGQEILALDIAISNKRLIQAHEDTKHTLESIEDAQQYMYQLINTLKQTASDNLVHSQNKVIGNLQDAIEQGITYTHATAYELEALQHTSNMLQQRIYSVIFYAYYTALYNAMKAAHIPHTYFLIMVDAGGIIPEDKRIAYLPEPWVAQ